MRMRMQGDPVPSGRRLDAAQQPILGNNQQRGHQQGEQQPSEHGPLQGQREHIKADVTAELGVLVPERDLVAPQNVGPPLASPIQPNQQAKHSDHPKPEPTQQGTDIPRRLSTPGSSTGRRPATDRRSAIQRLPPTITAVPRPVSRPRPISTPSTPRTPGFCRPRPRNHSRSTKNRARPLAAQTRTNTIPAATSGHRRGGR